jgi:phosphatidylinositol N-acetylglucosaminyltransferase subunit C
MHTTLLFIGCLRIIAPVLKTLTMSFSGDTIEALAIAFSVLHLASHDYAYVNSEVQSYSGTLALNAAMFTAIILASRLDDIDLVVLFILLAIICFSWFPATARQVKQKSWKLHVVFLAIQWVLSGVLTYSLDRTLFAIYQMCTALLVLGGPYCYLKMQTYKRSLSGPWDIAEVQ